jgi:hypothetical protein
MAQLSYKRELSAQCSHSCFHQASKSHEKYWDQWEPRGREMDENCSDQDKGASMVGHGISRDVFLWCGEDGEIRSVKAGSEVSIHAKCCLGKWSLKRLVGK